MSSPTRARGSSQLGAILRKNLLLKRRAPKTTCAEVLSPPLFLSILVLGYFLSETEVYGVGIYASTEVNVASLISTLGPLVSGSARVAVPTVAGVAGTAARSVARHAAEAAESIGDLVAEDRTEIESEANDAEANDAEVEPTAKATSGTSGKGPRSKGTSATKEITVTEVTVE